MLIKPERDAQRQSKGGEKAEHSLQWEMYEQRPWGRQNLVEVKDSKTRVEK